jgi:NADH-quinone oxidoreductase subunit A
MTSEILLSAPVAFIIVLAAAGGIYYLLGRLAVEGKASKGKGRPYACGEEQPAEQGIPDYGQFFPFAFFFTILHVVALTVATVPAVTAGNLMIAIFYVASALVGLSVLYRS